jgi:NDP-sugar pyrophosphorylase family protein
LTNTLLIMPKLNIVIPMAGRGSRFADAGYALPKPLIEVLGEPMIKLVIDNLRPNCEHRFIFLCQEEHLALYDLAKKLNVWASGCEVVSLNGITEGAACTVLLAKSLIDSDDPLMIANSDQWVDININNYLAFSANDNLDGCIMTMKANDPKWSFIRLNSDNQITEVVEKQVVSDEATVGIYNFKHGKDFVSAATAMINQNLRVNGEFYVAPIYNQLLESNAKIGYYNIGAEFAGMYGLGTPEDMNKILNLTFKPERILSQLSHECN